MQERVKEEFKERYGSDLSDTELRDAARAEMLARMEEQLASEGVDVKVGTAALLAFFCLEGPYTKRRRLCLGFLACLVK